MKRIDQFARLLIVVGMLAVRPPVGAQQTSAQYSVASWGYKDGMPSTLIFAVAQTSDGFLWLGTDDGLVRFDGVRFTHWRPAMPNGQLPGPVRALDVSRDGALLFGTGDGLVGSMHSGGLEATQLDSAVLSIQTAADGSVWAATAGALWHLTAGTLEHAEPPITLPGAWVSGPLQSGDGQEWVSTQTGLFHLAGEQLVKAAPGPAWLLSTPGGHATWLDAQGDLHSLESSGIAGRYQPLSRYINKLTTVIADRSGCLWAGTRGGGIIRSCAINGHTSAQQFTPSDGLSSDFIRAIFEDREHNVWVGTENGLDRLRRNRVLSLTRCDGLIDDTVTSIAAGKDGAVWLATAVGLQRLLDGKSTVHRRGTRFLSLLIGNDGRMWAGSTAGLLEWRNGLEMPVGKNTKFTAVTALGQDSDGVLWLFDAHRGLIREAQAHDAEAVTNRAFVHQSITALAAGPGDAVWFGLVNGNIIQEQGGEFHTYSAADGLSGARIDGLTFGPEGELWVATERGVCFLTGTRFVCRNSSSGLPGDRVLWVLPDSRHNLWLGYNMGVAQVNAGQLREWSGKQSSELNVRFFDDADGIVSSPDQIGNAPATFARDGRLWLTTSQDVAVLDPEHLQTNTVPPPVHVLGLDADGRAVDISRPVRLRPLTRSIQISFTGVCLTVPRKVRFRYELEGFDREWHDGGSRREAFYTNLPPGLYTFRVSASNEDGVWNQKGAALSFVLAPAYFQTLWFRLLWLAAMILLIAALFRLRLRFAQRIFRLRFEERFEERTRIAQELHDHLIQEMVGISMQLEVADELTPGNMKSKLPLERALALSRSAIASGRLTLQALRQHPVTGSAFLDSLRRTVESYPASRQCAVDYRFEGEERLLQPGVAQELSELGQEALRNALKHARPETIQVRLYYGRSAFELLIRDNGAGIPEEILRTGIPGHYGLAGMRERAAHIAGDFSIVSAPGHGTSVRVSVPEARAYQDSGDVAGNGSNAPPCDQPQEKMP
jgi:signal transduction histidine kinase/ligand-binding sensor domain-containing protein